MKRELPEPTVVALAAIPLAFVFSVAMRVVADQFQLDTPGRLFVRWFLSGYAPKALGGPAFYYLILTDLAFCWVVLLCLYWLIYKRFYDVRGGD